ncbi:ICP22 family protein [Mycolicibacterium rutilum]|nr:hypothetical protein [Mycolicibacterium rutilum]
MASKPVQLAASVNPIEAYFQLIETTAGNIGGLAETFLANPAPILTQIFENQWTTAGAALEGLQAFGGDLFSNFQTIAAPELEQAFELIGAGNFTGAAPHLVAALFQPALFAALPLLPVLQSALEAPVANLLAVTQQFQTIAAFAGIGLLAPLSSSVYATAEAIQNVVDAASAGDPIGVLGAVVAAPAVVLNGFLNGFGVDGGLLSDGLGAINVLMQIRDMIAAAITPSAAPASLPEASDLPSEDALTVAVSTSADETASVENASTATGSAESTGGSGDGSGTAVAGDEDDTEESQGEEASEGTEEDGTEQDDTEEQGKPGGGTDLTDGNKATPGETGGDESSADDSTGDTAADDDTDSDENAGSDDGGSDDGGSDDGGSDDGGSGGDTE